MSAYGFSEDSAKRIVAAVRKVEGDTGTSISVGPRFTGSQMSVVKVTSVSTPLSLGTRLEYNAKDGVLEVQNAVKIKEVNGQNLKVNNYYVGFFSGYTSGGDPVFLVSVSGSSSSGSSASGLSSGSASGSSGECFDVIQSINCDNGELEVTYATICPDSGTAIIVGQQNGNYTIHTRYSLIGGGSLRSGITLNLVGDVASPNANQYYGTNSSSVRGWYDLPDSGNSTNSITGIGSIANPFKLVNDTETPGNDKFYGTDSEGVRGWFSAVTTATITTIEESINTLQETVSGHTTDIQNLEGDLGTLSTTVINYGIDIADLQGRLNTAETALSTAESTISSLQSDLSTAQGTISSLQSDLSTAQGTISSLSSSVSSLESRVSTLENA